MSKRSHAGKHGKADAGKAPESSAAAVFPEASSEEESLVGGEVLAEGKISTGSAHQGIHAVAGMSALDLAFAENPHLQKKSKNTRRVLIISVILLVMIIAALGFLIHSFIVESQQHVGQLVQQNPEPEELKNEEVADDTKEVFKKTVVPDLMSLVGKTEEEAVKLLEGHGALVTGTVEINEEGNPLRRRSTVSLTEEPGDSRSGTPTVYLGYLGNGSILMAGYSAAMTSLGYGSISFVDAVNNEHVVEKTLADAGLSVENGSVQVPEDKTAYSTYASDGATLVKEDCSFEGTVWVNEQEYHWSAVVRYDYALANTSGNLSYTIRQVYVYIEAPVPEGLDLSAPEGGEAGGTDGGETGGGETPETPETPAGGESPETPETPAGGGSA